MARQAMWVHGNAVVMRFPGGKGDPIGSPHTRGRQMNGVWDTAGHIDWSDIVGLHRDAGVTFRGRAGNSNTFMVAVPTPVWRDGVRARLAMVGIKFKTDPGVTFTGLRVSDGPRDIGFPFPPMRGVGGAHCDTWDENVNWFNHPSQPEIESCVCINFDVSFDREGDVTFCAVGCDFIV